MSIVAIYLLVLSTVPCCVIDSYSSKKVDATKNIINQQSGHRSGDRDGNGSCSPFAICSTCPGFSFLNNVFCIVIAPSIPVTKSTFPVYSSGFISTFVSNIWQPPKFS